MVEETLDANVKELAQERVPKAFDALDLVMEKASQGAVTAARTVLEYAAGKPTQSIHHRVDGGIHVNILQFGDSHRKAREIDVTPPQVKLDGGDEPF